MALTIRVPVTVDIKPLNIVKMATDYQRPYIYALQAPALVRSERTIALH